MDTENISSNWTTSKKRYVARKTRIINHYGGKCVCCGEDELIFLTIDHIYGGGNAHRRRLTGTRAGGDPLYRNIIKENFPHTYQVMCFNCNHAKHVLGECPHKKAATNGHVVSSLEATSTT